ncbi:MAG: hypothetical protein ABFR97_08115 [Thermodesulfobacteriota bacterium]
MHVEFWLYTRYSRKNLGNAAKIPSGQEGEDFGSIRSLLHEDARAIRQAVNKKLDFVTAEIDLWQGAGKDVVDINHIRFPRLRNCRSSDQASAQSKQQ